MAIKMNHLLKPRHEVKDRLDGLRALLRETTNAIVVQTEAEIVALSEAVKALPNPDHKETKAVHRQEKLLDEMQALFAGFKIKPEKGRLKDLRRIRDLLSELNKLVSQFDK